MASSVFIWPGVFTNDGSTTIFVNPIGAPDGTFAAPGWTWSAQPALGAYRAAANTIDWAFPSYSGTVPMLRFSGGAGIILGNGIGLGWTTTGGASGTQNGAIYHPAAQTWQFTNVAGTAGGRLDTATDGTWKFRGAAGTAGTGNVDVGAKVTAYNSVNTAGWGVGAIQAQARVTAVTNTGSASIATYTVGAADGSFEVSANCLVTTSTTHSFSLDCVYTDESNASRTMVIPVAALAGTFVTTGLITNVTGAGPYESAVMHIRCKASTSITIRTSAGGTFTTVVYNAEGTIKQTA